MTTSSLMLMFVNNHNSCSDFICSLTDKEFVHMQNMKWSAGQQLAHLILCLKPISQALSSATYINDKFGTLNRVQMDYDDVINLYKTGLRNGGKAPDKFQPDDINISQKEVLQHDLNEILGTIQNQVSNYSEIQLDTLVLPHPFLGLLSIRELFYLLSYHPLHHLEQVKRNL